MNSALLGLVAALTWGIHDFIGRFASRAIGQLITTLGLSLSGLVVLSAIGFWRGIDLPSQPYDVVLCAIAGGAYALATLSLFAAYRIGSMSIVSPIAGSYPAIAVCFGFITGSRPGLFAWFAIASVIAGTFLVSQAGKSHEDSGHIAKGQLGRVLALSIATSMFFATSLIAGQVATPANGEYEVTWLARVFAVAIVLPFFAVRLPPAR
jgi:drug/metabolite transporter (DMT)-like permease